MKEEIKTPSDTDQLITPENLKWQVWKPKPSLFQRFRYWLIEKLVGNMPVVMNLVISRPKNYDGSMIIIDGNKPGIISHNVLLNIEGKAIIEASRDVDFESRISK